MSVRRTLRGLCCSNSRLSRLPATVFVQIAIAFLRQGLACRRKAMQAVLTHEPLDYLYIVLFADDLTEQLELLVRLVHHHGAARWGRRALQMVLCKLKTLSLFALTSLSGFL